MQLAAALLALVRCTAAGTASDFPAGPANRELHATAPPATLLDTGDRAPPVSLPVALWYELDEGVCVNGVPGAVFAFHEPADKGTSNDWVIQLGGPPTLNWCISEASCAIYGVPPTTPFKNGTNESLIPGGATSTNCTDNPSWCKANMAQISMGCTMDLLMGNNTHTVSANNTKTPFGNVSVLHFDGLTVLESSVKKLLSLGMNKADRVLLTGVAHGGTAVYLHADRIHAQIKASNPTLKRFGALPVDGLHPKHFTVLYLMYNNYADSWLTAALEALAGMAFAPSGPSPVLPGCAKANPLAEWKCLWVNETLPYIESSVFAINQMASVWDSQCMLEGQAVDNVLQMGCSVNNHFERGYRTCNQYPEYCDAKFVKNVTVPFQQQYIADYARSGLQKKLGNGGFFHSCYLGSYFHSSWAGQSIWDIIEIDGLTMHQAITNWWNEAKPPGIKCQGKEHCADGTLCPKSGVCPAGPVAAAAWTTDCVWNASASEPPVWSNDTCDDWHGNPPGSVAGCPPVSCKLYSQCPRPPWTNKYLCNPSCGAITVYY